MSTSTGIDWLDAVLDRDTPSRTDTVSRRDVQFALASGFELDEALWMLDIADPKQGNDGKDDAIKAADRSDGSAHR